MGYIYNKNCIVCGKGFNQNETSYRISVCSEECYNQWHETQKGTWSVQDRKKVGIEKGVGRGFWECLIVIIVVILVGLFYAFTKLMGSI